MNNYESIQLNLDDEITMKLFINKKIKLTELKPNHEIQTVDPQEISY